MSSIATSTSSSHKILTRVLTKGTTTTATKTLALHSHSRRQLSSSSLTSTNLINERIRSQSQSQTRSQSQIQIRPYSSSQLPRNTIRSFFPIRGSQHQHHHQQQQQKTNAVRLFSSVGKEDFYKLLGVSKEADKGTVKKAYFKLAKKHHPDANKGDATAAEQFKKVTEAYEVLSDEKQRELYDNYGHAGIDPNSGMGGGGGNPFGGGGPGGGFNFNDGSFHFNSSQGSAGGMDPEDLFDAFFGGGRQRQRGPRRGADLQMSVGLTFRDAVFGATKELNLRYQVQDRSTGKVEVKSREVEVKVPPGVNDGINLRLAGQGAEGDTGAPKGDLIVTCVVEEDEFFHRDGADVHVEIPISVTQAILGGTVDVETLTGIVEMKVPKGCQPESKMMMRGKGIVYLNRPQQKGNQIVHLKLQIPNSITQRQETLLREFDKEAMESGKGISGRLAKAAGSAFESLFGGCASKDDASKKEGDGSDSKESATDSKVDEEGGGEKKRQAQ